MDDSQLASLNLFGDILPDDEGAALTQRVVRAAARAIEAVDAAMGDEYGNHAPLALAVAMTLRTYLAQHPPDAVEIHCKVGAALSRRLSNLIPDGQSGVQDLLDVQRIIQRFAAMGKEPA